MTAGPVAPPLRELVVSVPDRTLLDALGDPSPGVEVVCWDMIGSPPRDRLDIVVVPYLVDVEILGALAGVHTGLVQSQTIGYDRVDRFLPPGHVYANAAGVHEASTAELALALALACQRGIPDFVRAATSGRRPPTWHRPSLADRRVLLIGYGGVGRAVEQRLRPFEVELVRVARSRRTDDDGPIHGMDELPGLLGSAEVVILTVPLTESTVHLVDEDFLAALPDGALVVNLARGRVADTAAVLAHASTGRLRFALDVTEPEPLPDGHELLTLPNVLVSPHVGGASSAMVPRMSRLLAEQVDRMQRDQPPLNVVVRS